LFQTRSFLNLFSFLALPVALDNKANCIQESLGLLTNVDFFFLQVVETAAIPSAIKEPVVPPTLKAVSVLLAF